MGGGGGVYALSASKAIFRARTYIDSARYVTKRLGIKSTLFIKCQPLRMHSTVLLDAAVIRLHAEYSMTDKFQLPTVVDCGRAIVRY